MSPLIISCSHHPESRSALLAKHAYTCLESLGATPRMLNLAQTELPFCDGHASYGHPGVAVAQSSIVQADGILLASPIYNYDLNAAAKNLLELTGKAWTGKVVGFLCAAGGHGSYMSIMPFANSLMLDFRCVIVPRFVYATGQAFNEGGICDQGVRERVEVLAKDLLTHAKALKGLTATAEA